MSIFRRSSKKILSKFSKQLYENAHIGAEIFCTAVLEQRQEELNNEKRMHIAHEFIYLFLYLTDRRLNVDFGQNKRHDIMSKLLLSCIELSTQEHIPHWSDVDKDKYSTEFLELYSGRVELYFECEKKHEEGATTVSNNYMHVFGKNVARLVDREQDVYFLAVASGLGQDLTIGANRLEGLKLHSFVNKLKSSS